LWYNFNLIYKQFMTTLTSRQTLTCINPSRSYRVGKLFINALAMGCLLFTSCKKETIINDEENVTSGSANNSARISATSATESCGEDRDIVLGTSGVAIDSWWGAPTVVKSCKYASGTPGVFTYDWVDDNTGTIGGIAKADKYGSAGYPKTINTIPDLWPAKATMNISSTTPNGGAWICGIYGWVDDDQAGYPYTHEFYITPYTSPARDAGKDPWDSYLTVDGVTYDVYKGEFKDKYGNPTGHFRFKATRQGDVQPGTVMNLNVRPFLNHFRSRGMYKNPRTNVLSPYLAKMGWAFETFNGSRGKCTLSNITIPN
jgi:hypothetical protein